MVKLSDQRRRVLALVESEAQSHRISMRLRIATTTVSGVMQWARRNGLATYKSRWSLTPAGRAALEEQG